MYIPSLTTILGGIFIAYITHSIWLMSQLFNTLKCSGVPCYTSYLDQKPRMQLALFTSINANPISTEVVKVFSSKNFNYWHEFHQDLTIDIPLKTRRNGTLFMQVVFALEGEPLDWKTLRRDGPTVIHSMSITDYAIPQAETFNLLRDNVVRKDESQDPMRDKVAPKLKTNAVKPVTHIMSSVYVTLLTDSVSLSNKDVPPEMARLIHVNRNQQILPILKTDIFNTRIKDLVQVTRNTTEFTINFNFKPISTGKLRLMLMVEHAMVMIQTMGFSKKDVEEVKGMFSDTNVYLLCCTVFVASIHLLFDFLSFKNDVIFWRKKKSYEGLSTRTTVWRAFSQIVIFLYLLDENTSMLVLVPAGLAVLIELWKSKKILKIDIGQCIGFRRGRNESNKSKSVVRAEKETEEFDKQGMRYLSCVLYPLCIAGAIYSLMYLPHKSWYSWTINSLVNGVYAFGFLFMLPQLFVNYKLKSVAALPWRAFMYKAFNTFIDDFFAFIITMPTAHRVACLRDDIVFLIYLYQRWLYPVDKSRIDSGLSYEETNDTAVVQGNDNANEKKRN